MTTERNRITVLTTALLVAAIALGTCSWSAVEEPDDLLSQETIPGETLVQEGAGPAPSASEATSHLSSPPTVTLLVEPALTPTPESTPTSEPTASVLPDGVRKSFLDLCWVAYAPTNYDPERQVFPSEESIREDLLTLRLASFSGLVTYGAELPVAAIAEETGFQGMILGVWDPNSDVELDRAQEAAQYDIVIGYVVGNEGLNDRYDYATLQAAVDKLKHATGLPVATTEEWEDYADQRLIDAGDWLFPNVHAFWHGFLDPQEAAEWTEARFRELQGRTNKPILFKEVGLPSEGLSGVTEANQATYYQLLGETSVPFVYFEAFDQPWKQWEPVEPYWGLFRQDRSLKSAVSVVCPQRHIERTAEDLLDEIERRAVAFFWQEADPQTGLIKDRANNFGPDDYDVSSIAAVGFGLAGITIGESRGWLSYEQAYERTVITLRFLRDEMSNEHGFYYHFVDYGTGERVWNSEVSSIDTALLLAGVLLAGEHFAGTEVESMADELYRRVDFQWMLTDGGQRPDELLLSHGWTPEGDFLPYRWDSYNELMLLYLLAIGSPTYPIPTDSWQAWSRPEGTYAGYTTFAIGPLFTHQFSQAWVDFRNREDLLGYDYWQSSVNATMANRQFCIDNQETYQTYGDDVWGLTASDGPDGYRAYGAPPGAQVHDGTVSPAAPAGSIPFTPELSRSALQAMYQQYGDRIWGRYGFSDAFNVDRDWWDQDVIGIDLGISLLMIENYRSGLVWDTFQRNEYVEQALKAVGLW